MTLTQSITNRFASSITQHRRWWFVVIVVATIVALAGLRRIDFDDNPRHMYMGDDRESLQLQELYDQFGPDDQDVLIVIQATDVFDRTVLYAARDLAGAVAKIDGIDRVYSIFSLRKRGSDVVPLIPRHDAPADELLEARRESVEHPLATGHFVSPDATTMLVVARLQGEPSSIAVLQGPVKQIRLLARCSEAVAPMTVRLTGHPPIRIDILGTLRRDQAVFLIGSAVLAIVLAALMFRRPAAVLIAVLPPMLGVVWIVGILSLCGLRINGINTVLPTLTFAIGLTDSIHLMVDLQRRRAAGVNRFSAVRSAIRELALPSLLTALTTTIGFGSLALAYEQSIRQFGIGCAAGILLNFVAVITVFPLLAGTWLADFVVPSPRHMQMAAILWNFSPLVKFVERYRRSIVAASFVSTVVLAAVSMNLRSEINMTEPIPSTSDSATALREATRAFGGGLYGYVVVQWPENNRLNTPEVIDTVARVHELVEAQPEFANAFSVRNFLRAASSTDEALHRRVHKLSELPSSELRRVVRPDLRRLVVSFHVADIGGSALVPAVERLERALREIEQRQPGFQFHVTGTFPAVARNLWNIIADLQWSLAGCTVLVFGVIALSLRSLRLSLISLLPDMLPLLVTTSFLVFTAEPLRAVSMLTFSLCFGISVDDSIHFLVKFQRALRGMPLVDAIEETFRETGAGIVTGTVIIVGAFSIMLLSSMPSVRSFAILCGLTMVAGLCTMLLLLPALLLCFGPKSRRSEPATTNESNLSRIVVESGGVASR